MTKTSSPVAASSRHRRQSRTQDLAYIAVFAALIIILAFIAIPIGAAGVPIVLQNSAVVLAGLVLGGRRGFLAATLFLALGLIGLPVLAGGRTTLSALAGPTIGYLAGYMASAAIAGAIAYRAPAKKRSAQALIFSIAAITGLVTQYFFGILGLVWRAGLNVQEATISQIPFLLPDAGKFALMVIIALGVHAAFPDLLSRSRR